MAACSSVSTCSSNEWTATIPAIQKLENLLLCSLCHQLMRDPHTLASCEHCFCKECIMKWLSDQHSSCPECGLPSWVKDIKPYHQLAGVISNIHQLNKLITTTPPRPDTANTPPENEIRIWEKMDSSKDAQVAGIKATPIRSLSESSSGDDSADIFLKCSHDNRLHPRPVTDSTRCDIQSCCSNAAAITPPTIHLKRVPLIQRKMTLGRKRTSSHRHSILGDSSESKVDGREPGRSQTKKQQHEPTLVPSSTLSSVPTSASSLVSDSVFPFSPMVTKTRSFEKLDSAAKVQRLCNSKAHTTSHSSFSSSLNAKITSLRHSKLRQLELDSFVVKQSTHKSPVLEEVKENRLPPNPITPSVLLGNTMRRNVRGETPLHMAAIKGDASGVKSLLAQGADMNAKDNAGWTPLHEACNHGHVNVAELLLRAGAMVNIPGYENATPLHDAVLNGHESIVSLLLKHGANPTSRSRYGYTPSDLAVSVGMKEIFLSHSSSLASSSSVCGSQSPANIRVMYQKVLILCSGLSNPQKAKLKDLVTLIGAELASDFASNVTHVVTGCDKDGCCLRTMKCLCAIASGKWLLNYSWVTQCLEEGVKVDEEPHEVRGVRVSGRQHLSEGASRGRINAMMKAPGLFDGCEFFFHGKFSPHPSKQDIQRLVSLSDGRILTREPKFDPDSAVSAAHCYPFHAEPESTFASCHQLIVYDPLTQRHKPDIHIGKKTVVVPAPWILDSICNFKLIDIP